MTSKVTFSAFDETGEGTSFGFNTVTLTAGNLAAQLALIETIRVAVNGVVLGEFDGQRINVVDIPKTDIPVDPNAQRETKWRVKYIDTVNPLGGGSFEIGMADLSLKVAGSPNLNIDSGAGATLKDALDAGAVSRLGNAISVTQVYHVGRNT